MGRRSQPLMAARTATLPAAATGAGPPRWPILGLSAGVLLGAIGVLAIELPALGLPMPWSEGLAFAGACLGLLVIVVYLLRELSTAPQPAVSAPVGRRSVPDEPAWEAPSPAPARPIPTPAAQLSASNAVRRAVAAGAFAAPAGSVASAAPELVDVPPEAPSPSDPEGGGLELTSIPGAYLQALGAQRDPSTEWTEVAPPIAASLPFAAGVQRPTSDRLATGSAGDHPSTGNLELELARLRARVRDLEGRRPPVPSSGPRPGSSPTVAAAPRGPEPPAPPVRVAVTARGCAGCGGAVSSNHPPPLCWGCGRVLCTGCYWRFGPGPGLHRCPDCVSKVSAGSTRISGGRAGAPTEVEGPDGPAGSPTSPPALR
jgi:hypothetical protein